MQSQITTINSEKQNVYVGLDVHSNNWKVSIVLNNTVFKTFSQDPCAKTLGLYLRKNFPGSGYYSAYEAGFSGYSTHRKLQEEGITNIIVNPADIPTTDKERKQKEDKRDSRKIAKALRNGELEGIYVPSMSSMEFRTLVRFRNTLVKDVSRNKNRVKSLLKFQGIIIPKELHSASSRWSARFTKWLEEEVRFSSDYGNLTIKSLIEVTKHNRQKLLELTKILRQIPKDSHYGRLIKLLCTIPGVGLITAVTIIAEIEDMNRFKTLDKLCSYVGIVPSTNSSGATETVRGITPRSNRPLRNVIIESSWVAVRNNPVLAKQYNELCYKMESNKAIIRIAKKMLAIIRYVMKHEKEYKIDVN